MSLLGQLARPTRWWTLLEGWRRWVGLPDAPEAEQFRRLLMCSQCPHARRYEEVSLGFAAAPASMWCGEPGRENGVECGCLLAAEEDSGYLTLTIDGRQYRPAGKTEKAGVTCADGRWA